MARRKGRNKRGSRKAGERREKAHLGRSEARKVCQLEVQNKDVWIKGGNGAFGQLESMIEP